MGWDQRDRSQPWDGIRNITAVGWDQGSQTWYGIRGITAMGWNQGLQPWDGIGDNSRGIESGITATGCDQGSQPKKLLMGPGQ